jgi:hypothetical protein
VSHQHPQLCPFDKAQVTVLPVAELSPVWGSKEPFASRVAASTADPFVDVEPLEDGHAHRGKTHAD